MAPRQHEPAEADDTFEAATSPQALLTRLRAFERERVAHMRRERFKALNWIVACLALIVAGAVHLATGPAEPFQDLWTGAGTLLAAGAIIGGGIWGLRNVPRMLGFDPQLDRTREVLALIAAMAADWHPESPVSLRFDLRELEDTAPRRKGTSPYSGATKKWYRLPRLELVGMLADGTMLDVLMLESAKTKAGSYVRHRHKLRLRLRPGQAAWTGAEELKLGWAKAFSVARMGAKQGEMLVWGDMRRPDEVLPVLQAIYQQLGPRAA